MNLDDRLDNWSRFYRVRMKMNCCGSIEGKKYQAPWRQWVELSEIQHSKLIDWFDAEQVELAWKSMLGTPKLLLKYCYMANFPDYVICRKSGIKPWEFKGELHKAKQIINRILMQKSATCYKGTVAETNNLNREPARDSA
jgi:hypothetical protein